MFGTKFQILDGDLTITIALHAPQQTTHLFHMNVFISISFGLEMTTEILISFKLVAISNWLHLLADCEITTHSISRFGKVHMRPGVPDMEPRNCQLSAGAASPTCSGHRQATCARVALPGGSKAVAPTGANRPPAGAIRDTSL